MWTTKRGIKRSCKRKGVFHDLQINDPEIEDKDITSLPDMCDHKWNYRERAVDVVHRRYSHLLETLDWISENGKSDEKAEAEGLLNHWMLPMNLYITIVFSDVFSQLGPLSNTFQAEKTDLSSALQLTQSHILELKKKRSTLHGDQVWQVASALAKKCQIQMIIPQKRVSKTSTRLRDYLVNSSIGQRQLEQEDQSMTQPSDFYRTQALYPLIDKIIAKIKRRFVDEDPILRGIAACHPDSSNFLSVSIMKPFAEAYHISGSLEAQIQVCQTYLNNSKKPEGIGEIIRRLVPHEGFPDLRQLLQIALTLPIANVSAERSFSTLRQIRTYIRSTMKEERLSALAILSIERAISKSIDLELVVDTFARMPNLRDASKANLLEKNARKIDLA